MTRYDLGKEQILEIIASELYFHPWLNPVDLFKVMYQASFGPFHIVKDKDSLMQAISREIWYMEHDYLPLVQKIGRKYARISLNIFGTKRNLEDHNAAISAFAEWMLASCEVVENPAEISKILWKKYLPLFKESLRASEAEWTLAQSYIDKGSLPSHSPEYHAEYHPHYRIVKLELTQYKRIFFGED